ncbi:MAG: alkylation repair protein [Paenibacillaceae bacterium]|jgi:3-methyladenine DNA glycosylase AlkC|nr:alkylation repair protein [Paenibacillaceae bacterium]
MYTRELIEHFAVRVNAVYTDFNQTLFILSVLDDSWEERELKDRYRHIAHVLGATLPRDYGQAVGVLDQLAGESRGFPYMFFPEYIAMFGLPHWDLSVDALRRYTVICSSEFAVRPFIEQDQQRMLAVMLEWAQDPDEHVRRLASEGCRPRLPWGKPLRSLIADPTPILPILERLKADPSEYVRRSVANNLNDISKDHPQLVLSLASRWQGTDKGTDWIIKHACRTLLKKGEPEALRLFGFGDGDGNGQASALVEITGLTITPASIRLGEEIRFSFRLSSPEPASFRLQFAVDYVKANGKTSPKRFHLPEHKQFCGTETVEKRLSFQDYTTRKHYPGEHRLAILVNGEEKAATSFMVGE